MFKKALIRPHSCKPQILEDLTDIVILGPTIIYMESVTVDREFSFLRGDCSNEFVSVESNKSCLNFLVHVAAVCNYNTEKM